MAYDDEPYALLVVKSSVDGLTVSWTPPGCAATGVVARFLETSRIELDESDLSSDVTFLYVVMSHAPQSEDDRGDIGTGTPIAEFGFGAPPASPEDWPSVQLKTLLQASVDELHRRSP